MLSDRVKTDLLSKLAAMPALERYRERCATRPTTSSTARRCSSCVYSRPMPYDGRGACAMAALSLMLSARDAGLGTCWIGFSESLLESQELKAELGVPAGYRVVAPIIVGHPVDFPPPTPRDEPGSLLEVGVRTGRLAAPGPRLLRALPPSIGQAQLALGVTSGQSPCRVPPGIVR